MLILSIHLRQKCKTIIKDTSFLNFMKRNVTHNHTDFSTLSVNTSVLINVTSDITNHTH